MSTLRGSLAVALVAVTAPAARAEDEYDWFDSVPDHPTAHPTPTQKARKTPTPTPKPTRTPTPTPTETETPAASGASAEADTTARGPFFRRLRPRLNVHLGDGRCDERLFYKVNHLSPMNFFLPRTRYIDGPGGSMTVTVTREHEVTAFLETESERQDSISRPLIVTPTITAGELVRNLRRLGLPHLEERHMVFSGHEYTRDITENKYGNMWYRVFGYRVGWSAWSVLGTCRHVLIDKGLANIPSRVEGWRYWETDRPRFKGRVLSQK
ncbi:hypothetical protein [Nonomuraea jiangxiensis]|uniref:hypothetical protein n=1 Tax=Nonomuraea jiangxiensis TaxID=633440 RepID=UPI0015A4E95F|nr:hypothetical protein [Nonomuraea jiangxiensis]